MILRIIKIDLIIIIIIRGQNKLFIVRKNLTDK